MRPEKANIVAELAEKMKRSPFVLVADYQRMNVGHFGELRNRLLPVGAEMHVVKNSFLKRALVDSSRCYFCYDAPCIEACPTGIDIPNFIRKIATGNIKGAAVTILEENIFGGICARVCPTEILCEQACVRNLSEDKPVNIGALQRYATDLAQGHELGRQAELRVERAGLLLEGTRVTEPWGPASAQEAERRRAQIPEVQSRVDLATAHIGRARGRLQREIAPLTEGFSAHSRDAQSARQAPLPRRRSRPT